MKFVFILFALAVINGVVGTNLRPGENDVRLYGIIESDVSTTGAPPTLTPMPLPQNVSHLAGPMASVADFTYCPGCAGCGAGQCCGNQMEFAMNDGPFWRQHWQPAMSGGCGRPDCDCCTNPGCGCAGPSCPHGSLWGKAFKICHGGKCATGYLGGCCPSKHPCNIAKSEGQCGAPSASGYCRSDRDHIDACPKLREALGYPGSGSQVTFELQGGGGGGCSDTPPSGQYTCAQQAGWGKCGESWMQGYCCKSCHNCQGCR